MDADESPLPEPKPKRRRAQRPIDLNKVAEEGPYRVEIRSHDRPEELEARLRREAADAWFARVRDLLLFLAALAGIIAIAWMCLDSALDPTSPAEDKKWAMSVLSSIVAGAVGFLLGKNQK